ATVPGRHHGRHHRQGHHRGHGHLRDFREQRGIRRRQGRGGVRDTTARFHLHKHHRLRGQQLAHHQRRPPGHQPSARVGVLERPRAGQRHTRAAAHHLPGAYPGRRSTGYLYADHGPDRRPGYSSGDRRQRRPGGGG